MEKLRKKKKNKKKPLEKKKKRTELKSHYAQAKSYSHESENVIGCCREQ